MKIVVFHKRLQSLCFPRCFVCDAQFEILSCAHSTRLPAAACHTAHRPQGGRRLYRHTLLTPTRVCLTKSPKKRCQEIHFQKKKLMCLWSLYCEQLLIEIEYNFKIRRMSDSEDFSGDEEGGKLKFQPTLRSYNKTFWWKWKVIIDNFDFSVEDQPLEVIKRVKALKKLQFENIKHEVSRGWLFRCH